MKTSVLITLLAAVAAAHASSPVGVSYTVTGTSGAYDLNFTFANNTGDDNMGIYFMGVDLPTLTGSPAPFVDKGAPFVPYNDDHTGPMTSFKSNWIDFDEVGIANGSSMNGFMVHTTATTAPTSVEWFAYGIDTEFSYSGAGSFSGEARKPWNPGFTGIAHTQAVPEPCTMLALGAGALGLLRRKKR